MRNLKRFLCLAVAAMFTFCMMGVCVPMQASAETVPMTWKEMDKAYITLIVDDNNASLQQMYDIVTKEYGFPLCVAVPVKSYDKSLSSSARPDSLTLLHEIQDNGGEILSHLLTHKVLNRDVPWATVDYELGESYRRLTAEGFRVNGVILAGGGGTEDTDEEYRGMIEEYTSKYYKYSDYYGVSTQYYKKRNWIAAGWSANKRVIDNAISNKGWEVMAWHHFPDVFGTNLTEADLRKVLDYLKQQQELGKLEVVTYREVHKKFGDWATPVDLDTIPTKATTTTTTTATTTTTLTTTANGRATTTTAKDVTATVKSTTSSKTRPVHTTPTFLTSTTAAGDVNEDVPESQAPDASTDTPADTDADRPTGEKDPAPWIPWVIGGAAVALCTTGVITAALMWRKKRTPPTE